MNTGQKVALGIGAVILLLIIIFAATGALKLNVNVSNNGSPPASDTSTSVSDQLQARSSLPREDYTPQTFSFAGSFGGQVSGTLPRGWQPGDPAPGVDLSLGALLPDTATSGEQFRANAVFTSGPIPLTGVTINSIEDAITAYENLYATALGQELPQATIGEQYRATVAGLPAYVLTLRNPYTSGSLIYQEQYTIFVDASNRIELTLSILDEALAQRRGELDELISSLQITPGV